MLLLLWFGFGDLCLYVFFVLVLFFSLVEYMQVFSKKKKKLCTYYTPLLDTDNFVLHNPSQVLVVRCRR